MSYSETPSTPPAGRIAGGLVAAAAIQILVGLSGPIGLMSAVLSVPQFLFLFLPLSFWLLPRAPMPVAAAAGLGVLTAPVIPAILNLRGDDLPGAFIVQAMLMGAISGAAYGAAVAVKNPYFSEDSRKGRSAR